MRVLIPGTEVFRFKEGLGAYSRLLGEAFLLASITWDVERRLIARPFPQPFATEKPNKLQWTSLREELSRISGAVVFVGGQKRGGIAEGVIEEAKLAEEAGCFLLPVGAIEGAAAQISASLVRSKLSTTGASAGRPTDEELFLLSKPDTSPKELARQFGVILKRVGRDKG